MRFLGCGGDPYKCSCWRVPWHGWWRIRHPWQAQQARHYRRRVEHKPAVLDAYLHPRAHTIRTGWSPLHLPGERARLAEAEADARRTLDAMKESDDRPSTG